MVAHRPLRQVQGGGDVGDGAAVPRGPQHLGLARGQRARPGGQRLGGQRGVDHPQPGVHPADGVGQLPGRGVLDDEPAGPRLQRPAQVAGPAERRDDEHPARRQRRPQRARSRRCRRARASRRRAGRRPAGPRVRRRRPRRRGRPRRRPRGRARGRAARRARRGRAPGRPRAAAGSRGSPPAHRRAARSRRRPGAPRRSSARGRRPAQRRPDEAVPARSAGARSRPGPPRRRAISTPSFVSRTRTRSAPLCRTTFVTPSRTAQASTSRRSAGTSSDRRRGSRRRCPRLQRRAGGGQLRRPATPRGSPATAARTSASAWRASGSTSAISAGPARRVEPSDEPPGQLGLDGEHGQGVAEDVVQVAGEPAPLVPSPPARRSSRCACASSTLRWIMPVTPHIGDRRRGADGEAVPSIGDQPGRWTSGSATTTHASAPTSRHGGQHEDRLDGDEDEHRQGLLAHGHGGDDEERDGQAQHAGPANPSGSRRSRSRRRRSSMNDHTYGDAERDDGDDADDPLRGRRGGRPPPAGPDEVHQPDRGEDPAEPAARDVRAGSSSPRAATASRELRTRHGDDGSRRPARAGRDGPCQHAGARCHRRNRQDAAPVTNIASQTAMLSDGGPAERGVRRAGSGRARRRRTAGSASRTSARSGRGTAAARTARPRRRGSPGRGRGSA